MQTLKLRKTGEELRSFTDCLKYSKKGHLINAAVITKNYKSNTVMSLTSFLMLSDRKLRRTKKMSPVKTLTPKNFRRKHRLLGI